MCKIIKSVVKIISAGIVSMGLLSVFAFVYNYSGVHINNSSGATDYKWQENQYAATMTEGFSWLKMDEDGFNNTTFKSDDVDILLMGSSHMEAVNVAQSDNVAALLNELAPSYNTYNIGVSGHTIYTCVNNIGSASDMYEPTEYIVLETDTVKLDTEKMLEVIDGNYSHIRSYDSGMLYLLQKYIPAFKSIYKAVDEWQDAKTQEVKAVEVTATGDTPDRDSYYYETLNAFLKKAADDSGAELVIFYQPETKIDETGNLADNGDSDYRKLFAEACKANGIQFIDMSDDFKSLYDEQHILAHGFSNTAVGTGHLNKYGHRVIAERLVKELHLAEG